MDKIYKLTANEYARMRGITTSAVRKRRLKGLEENNFKKIGSNYYYRTPERDRPNIVEVTPHNNPKFTGSDFRPKKRLKDYYKKKRRRNVPEGEENYHNARNGWQLKQLNDMRKLTRLENDLSEDGILEIKDDIIEVAKQRVADRKKEEAKRRASHQSAINEHKNRSLKNYGGWINESNAGYNDPTYHNGNAQDVYPDKFRPTNRGDKKRTKEYYG
jgi:hypothetical protein|tara:strand:- start:981 stop:1628 length:648 start_codon:yes stop_codon:yes gene_type:complete